jgi:hypothetical protein
MADILLTETIFTGRSDTGYGTHLTPNQTILPDVINPPAAGAWVDGSGDYWAIKNGALTFNPANLNQGFTSGSLNAKFYRPISEGQLQSSMIVEFRTGPTTGNMFRFYTFIREQPNGSGLMLDCRASQIVHGWHNSGSEATGYGSVIFPANLPGKTTGGFLLPNTNYILKVSAITSAPNTTTLAYSIADRVSGEIFASNSASATFVNDNSVHTDGVPAIGARSDGAYIIPTFTRIATYYQSTSNLNASTTVIQAGSYGQGVVVSGTGTSWITNAPAFAYSDATVTQVGAVQVLSDTKARVTLNVSSSEAGKTLVITDPTQAAPNTASVSIVAAGTRPVMVDMPVAVPDTDTTIKFTFDPAHEGKAPYTYKAYRGRTSTFAKNAAGVLEVTSGIDGLTLTDTPPDGKIYCYRIEAIDSSGTPVAGISLASPGVRGYKMPTTPTGSRTLSGTKRIVIQGDSIISTLYGPLTTIYSNLFAGVSFVNAGMSGSAMPHWSPSSGYTPNYYETTNLGTQSALPLKQTIQAAGGAGYLTNWLGANDGETKAVWKAALEDELMRLTADFPSLKMMHHYPYWISRGESGNNDRMMQYADAIDEVASANPGKLYIGDRNFLVYSATRTLTSDGTHLTTAGSTAKAQYEATAFANAFAPADFVTPTRISSIVETDGKVTVSLSELVSGNTGFSLKVGGVDRTFSIAGTGATRVLTPNPLIYTGETVQDSYAPGDVVDLAGNALVPYNDLPIINNSVIPVPDTTAPAIPMMKPPVAYDGQVDLSWHSNEDDIAGYELERDGVVLDVGDARGYVDSELTNGIERTYRIRAYDVVGNRSAWSAAQTVIPNRLLAVPEGFVRVKWDYGFKRNPGPSVNFRFQVKRLGTVQPIWIGNEMQDINACEIVATVPDGTGSILLPWRIQNGIWACMAPNGEEFAVILSAQMDGQEVQLKDVIRNH